MISGGKLSDTNSCQDAKHAKAKEALERVKTKLLVEGDASSGKLLRSIMRKIGWDVIDIGGCWVSRQGHDPEGDICMH